MAHFMFRDIFARLISLAKLAATGAPAACAATSTLASKKGTRSMPLLLLLSRLQRDNIGGKERPRG